jgi:hypothetical protein
MDSSPSKRRKVDEALAQNHVNNFIPKKKVQYLFGRTTLNVYPETDNTMNDHELALAFNVNKSAVTNSPLEPENRLVIMAERHNTTNIVDVGIEEWTTTVMQGLNNPTNLRAISYHNYEGNIINEALTAAGTLRPIQNGPINQCRPPNVVHAKIEEGTVDLANFNNNIPTTIRVLFFIRLPVGDQNANNAAGAGRNLHTFTGPSDYLTLPIAEYQNLIYFHPDSVYDTYDLLPPTFTSPRASMDVESKVMVIHKQVIKLVYNRILEQIFKNICPTFIDNPFATLNKVRQVTMLSDGSMHKSSVRDYYQKFQTVVTTLPHSTQWPSNPFRQFVDGLDKPIKDRTETDNFRHHITTTSISRMDQIRLIQEAFAAACLAESELACQRLYIQDTMKEVHGFYSMPDQSNLNLSQLSTANGNFIESALSS